jgi:hypothetical protein
MTLVIDSPEKAGAFPQWHAPMVAHKVRGHRDTERLPHGNITKGPSGEEGQ